MNTLDTVQFPHELEILSCFKHRLGSCYLIISFQSAIPTSAVNNMLKILVHFAYRFKTRGVGWRLATALAILES